MSAPRRWVPIAHDMIDDPDVWGRDPRVLDSASSWIWILTRANWRDNPGHNPPLRAGQLLTTQGKLATAWGVSRSVARRRVDRWQAAGLVELSSIGRATLITVCAWGRWQVQFETQLRRNRDATETQLRRKLPEQDQPLAESETQLRRNTDATETQLRRATTVPENQLPTTNDQKTSPPNLATRAGRERAYPAKARLARSGSRLVYPEPFDRLLAAYPTPSQRGRLAPAAAYPVWRARAIEGEDVADRIITEARAFARSFVPEGKTSLDYVPALAVWLKREPWQTPSSQPNPTPMPDAWDLF